MPPYMEFGFMLMLFPARHTIRYYPARVLCTKVQTPSSAADDGAQQPPRRAIRRPRVAPRRWRFATPAERRHGLFCTQRKDVLCASV